LNNKHKSVLLYEAVDFLIKDTDGFYIDGTLGYGGHTSLILEKLSKKGRLLGIDCDINAIEYCQRNINDKRFEAIHGNYSDCDIFMFERDKKADGILLDLGVSSPQFDDADRGFSFRFDKPLDMRMDKSNNLTAEKIINTFSEKDLADIFYKYGEEKKSRIFAKRIIDMRKKNIHIKTTGQLAKIAESIYGKRNKIHPATRIFQALRIKVNDELKRLTIILDKMKDFLNPGARIVIISFHSLEDRIVKNHFKHFSKGCICPPILPECRCGGLKYYKLITKKAVIPNEKEISANIRSRSAKMRVAEFIGDNSK